MEQLQYPVELIHTLALDILNDKGKVFRREGDFCLIDLHDEINLTTDHIRAFVKYGTKCFHCGVGEGANAFYQIEPVQSSNKDKNAKRFRLQLYVIKDNKKVAMTLDHIIPRACGGKKRSFRNWQPLCHICNQSKGHIMTEADIALAIERGIYEQIIGRPVESQQFVDVCHSSELPEHSNQATSS